MNTLARPGGFLITILTCRKQHPFGIQRAFASVI